MFCPVKTKPVCLCSSTIQIDKPISVFFLSRIDSQHHTLTPKFACEITDQLRFFKSRSVYRDLVCSILQKNIYIFDAADSSTNSKRNIDMMSDPVHQFTQCLSFFNRCRDIEEYQFVRTLPCIKSSQLNRVTCIPKVYKIGSLDGAAVFYIKTWYDSFR